MPGAVIVDAVRTPIGRAAKGSLAGVRRGPRRGAAQGVAGGIGQAMIVERLS
jgi:hypothetical protein